MHNEENTATNGVADRTIPAKAHHIMESLLKMGHQTSTLKEGDIVEGKIAEKQGARVFVDLGAHGTGIIYGREYQLASDILKGLNEGDAVNAKVVEPDNEDGYVELSLKEAGKEQKWRALQNMMQSGEVLELPVLEANRGGLILEAQGIRGFLPASQMSPQNYPRVDGGDKEKILVELQKLVGQPLKVKIIDVYPNENKLIFTEKKYTSEETRNTLAQYKVGDVVEGEITSVVDFGAFMKITGTELEGLIHISEIDWMIIEDPREILKTGNKVQAKIIDVQGDRISLSLKQLKEDPWTRVEEKYHKGDIVKGKITKLNPFGAFAQLDKDIHGLVHVSEFPNEAKMREALILGEEYNFKILLLDPKDHKMSLGIVREDTPSSAQ